MESLILASNFNLFEGFFWIFVGIVAIIVFKRVPRTYKPLALFASGVLIIFGISDFVQVVYGSFLVLGMEWLLLWKMLNVFGLIICMIWYFSLRLTHSNASANSTDTGQ